MLDAHVKTGSKTTLLSLLFHRPMFQIREVHDVASVDLASGIVAALALAGGISDGIGLGGNTKAAIIRMGLLDAATFIKHFFPTSKSETLFESCGVADLIALSMSKEGRHRKCAESFGKFMTCSYRLSAKEGGMRIESWEKFAAQVWEEVIQEELGAACQFVGLDTLKVVWQLVLKNDLEGKLPLLRSLYRVAIKGDPPSSLVEFDRQIEQDLQN